MPPFMAPCGVVVSRPLPKPIGMRRWRSTSRAHGTAARRWCRRCAGPAAAAIGLTRGLARELGRDRIRVNALAPSAVLTEGTREFFADKLDRALDVIRSGQAIARTLDPSDLVGAVLWLVSDASALVSGQTIAVDGGTVLL